MGILISISARWCSAIGIFFFFVCEFPDVVVVVAVVVILESFGR